VRKKGEEKNFAVLTSGDEGAGPQQGSGWYRLGSSVSGCLYATK
jgi:hypothetical protein